MGNVLLTLGRFPKGLDIARSFAAAGWRVVVADPYKSHLLGASKAVARSVRVPAPADHFEDYLSSLARIVAEERIDLVVPVSEEVMYVTLLRARVPSHVRIFAMPAELLHRVHDKWHFVELASELGLAVPRSALAGQVAASGIAAEGAFIVKQRHSCGGDGLSFHAKGETLPQEPQALVQQRIHGSEHSSCTLAHAGSVQATAIYRPSVLSGTVAVGFERLDHPAIDAWIERFVAATHWTGFISFDFIVDETGAPFAIECNPRVTSGIHFFETADIAKAILDPMARLRLRKECNLQQFWACLQEAQGELPNVLRFAGRVRQIFRTRDVSWSAVDPLPLLTMPWTAREILINASRTGVSLAVAATRDLAWTAAAQTQFMEQA